MRMLPSRYLMPKPAQIKRQVAQVKHLAAPLKGLSQSSKLVPGDPLTGTILKNFVVDDDRITARAGYVKMFTDAALQPVEHLVPFYGQPPRLAGATNHTLINAADGALVKDGFTSNDWHWTAFSNLSQTDFTVMVNGHDGIWSWTGGLTPTGLAVPVVSISKANPAVVTVDAIDIGHFFNFMNVTIAGAAGDFAVANGNHVITSVGTPANSFTLPLINTSAATGTSGAGITATPQGSIVKETVTAPSSEAWIVPDQFAIVLSHMNRLWFADSANLAVYYLPLQSKSGEVKVLPLNAVFRRGGHIRALATWTIDGGIGLDDQLVIFSSNGEAVIYSGTDPDTDFSLVGIFRFDAPMSKHCTINYGGDLYVLISTGLVPMTTVIRAETEKLGQSEKSVLSLFLERSTLNRDQPGWQTMLNPSSGRLICNMPGGAPNRYDQMIRHMPRTVWSQWIDIPAHCWGWIDPYLYFGDDSGSIYRMHPQYLNDNGQPITIDVQFAWSQYGTPAIKHFKMVQPYIITDGDPKLLLDMKVDYDYSEPFNQPDVTFAQSGAEWDTATWDEDYWASGQAKALTLWTGVAKKGRVGGPRLTARILNCSFALSGFDVTYETGAVLG